MPAGQFEAVELPGLEMLNNYLTLIVLDMTKCSPIPVTGHKYMCCKSCNKLPGILSPNMHGKEKVTEKLRGSGYLDPKQKF